MILKYSNGIIPKIYLAAILYHHEHYAVCHWNTT